MQLAGILGWKGFVIPEDAVVIAPGLLVVTGGCGSPSNTGRGVSPGLPLVAGVVISPVAQLTVLFFEAM